MARPGRLGLLTAALVVAAVVLGVVVLTRDRSPRVVVVTTSSPTRRPGTPVRTCEESVGTVNNKPQWDSPPEMKIDASKSYRAAVDTSKGRIVIDLDPQAAPKTVNNFVFLSRCGFYDGGTFHRVAKDFVIQGGDPSGTGRGGPGYTFADELPSSPGYPLGSVAMANSGPNTNGSQFFIVTGQSATRLPANYSLFGRVVEGQDVAKSIEVLPVQGGGQDGRPTEAVTIQSVTITET